MPNSRQVFFAIGLTVLFCLLTLPLAAQVKFERLSWDQGISQSQINCIVQDRRHFLWIGTNNGLNLYNGYEFREFNHDPKDSLSLSNSRVWDIYESRDSTIWVATWGGGLNKLDRGTGEFTAFRHNEDDLGSISSDDVRTICEDKQGNIWVGTWGGSVSRLNTETGVFNRYEYMSPDSSKTSENVWTVYATEDGEILLGTNTAGILRYDAATDVLEPLLEDEDDLPPSLLDVSALHSSGDTLWVGTWGSGLFRLTRSDNSLRHFVHKPGVPSSISNDYIRSIVEDESQNIWVGTWGGGVSILQSGTGDFRRYQYDSQDRQSLSDDLVSSICRGASNIMWVGTWGGLNVYDQLKQKFAHFRARGTGQAGINRNEVHAIAQADAGTLWVGAWSGLNRFELDRDEWRYRGSVSFENSNLSAYDTDIRVVLPRDDGKLWVGSVGGGLMVFDPSTNRFQQFKHDARDSTSISHNDVRAIIERKDGRVWVGTSGGGFNLFDPATKKFERFMHRPDAANSLVNNFVSTMVVDSSGRLWVGTLDGGLSLYDHESAQFVNFRQQPGNPRGLSSNSINHMYVDPDDILWIGTDRGGLNCLPNAGQVAGESAQFERFTVSDGLVNNRVYAVCADTSGVYWISADQGLSRLTYDADSNAAEFRNYDINDGLQGHEFNEGACYVSPIGELFFGGPNGFNAFQPERIKDNPWVPPIELTNLTVFGEPYLLGADPAKLDEVVLNYDQNFFSFEFVALNYTNSQKNRYEFMLEGFDRDWVQAGTRRYTNYTNLDGGTYTFYVRGSNNDGAWNTAGTTLKVRVIPPFWEEIWFKVLVIAFAVGLIMLIYTLRMRGLQLQKKLLEHEVSSQTAQIRARNDELASANAAVQEQRDNLESTNVKLEAALKDLRLTQDQLVHAEKMASLGELTAGIAHEIQNPLNFVNNFADVSAELCSDLEEQLEGLGLDKGDKHEDIEDLLDDMRGNMQRIKQHGSRATNIVSGMLEHSRGIAGEHSATDVSALIREAVNLASHGMRAKDSSFDCQIEMDLAADVPSWNLSSPDIQRALINLVNNGCYAAMQRRENSGPGFVPKVEVSSACDADGLTLCVRDNGVGIAVELREKIFTPFFTTKPSGQGTGLGLSITYDIVTGGHGGTITVQSEPGEYSEFRIWLPRGKG